jgi:hypothetical protein
MRAAAATPKAACSFAWRVTINKISEHADAFFASSFAESGLAR